jgi:putative transposase
MARQPRIEFPGALYHVTARGIERREIYRDDRDRERFLSLLAVRVPRFEVSVLAYCLMTNHVHLAVQTGATPLQRFMKSLQTAYAQYFNRRHDRIGPLFAGRYKAFLVDRDRYFQALIRYIHLNPVEARIVDRPGQYPWSSFGAYFASAHDWLDVDGVLKNFGRTRVEARQRLRKLLNPVAPLDRAYEDLPRHLQAIIGEEDFATRVLSEKADPVLIRKAITVERFAEAVAKEIAIPAGKFRDRSRQGDLSRARALTALLARDIAAIPLARTAQFFVRERSSISRSVTLLEREVKQNRKTAGLVGRLRDRLLG